MLKKVIALLIASCLFSGSVLAQSIPAEQYEHLTHTKINPWFDAFHLTTEENIKNNYKGGEGYQLVYSAAISDVNPNAMMIATDTSGVYWTDNGGELWHPMKTKIAQGVNSLAFYPGSDKVCFATCFDYYPSSGIYKSLDGGNTWERKFSFGNSKNHNYGRITFGKETGQTTADGLKIRPIYTCSPAWPYDTYKGNPKYAGVFRSDDVGETFYSVGLCDYRVVDIWADMDSDMLVTATREAGIQVSPDGGNTWRCVTGELTQEVTKTDENGEKYTEVVPVTDFRTVTVNPADENNWAAATKDTLYMTYDGGRSWEKIDAVWGPGGWNSLSSTGYILRLRYTYPNKETGKNALILTLTQCSRSTRISYDNGKTFETIYDHTDFTNETTTAWTSWYPGAVALTPCEPDLILTAWNGVTISYDHGQSFKLKNSGISGAMIYDFVFDDNGQVNYVGMLDFGIAKRVDGYEGDFPPMEIVNSYPTMDGGSKSVTSIAVDPNDKNHIIATTGSGWVYGHAGYLVDSYDNLNTFGIYSDMRQRVMDKKNETGQNTSPREIKYSNTNSDVIYATGFVSEDRGKTWRETTVMVREISPFDGDIAYGFKGTELVVSYDRARTWKGTGIKISNMREVVADIFEPYVVYVPVHGYSRVYKVDLKKGSIELWNEENGFWITKENGEKYHPEIGFQMRNFNQDPKDPNHMIICGLDFYGSANYLFESYDGGKSWKWVEGLPGGCSISCLEFHPTEPRIYIGSSQGAHVYYYEKYGMQEENQ